MPIRKIQILRKEKKCDHKISSAKHCHIRCFALWFRSRFLKSLADGNGIIIVLEKAEENSSIYKIHFFYCLWFSPFILKIVKVVKLVIVKLPEEFFFVQEFLIIRWNETYKLLCLLNPIYWKCLFSFDFQKCLIPTDEQTRNERFRRKKKANKQN